MADYSEFADAAPSNEAFAPLHAAVSEAHALSKDIALIEEHLAARKAALNSIIYGKLPTMMAEMKLQKFSTADGIDIALKDEVSAHISEDNKGVAYQWLEDNQHGGIIKREISVAFAKGQEEQAKGLLDLLGDKYPNLSNHKSVHASTLKAWATEMLKKGAAFPLDKFGVRQVKVAKIPNLGKPTAG